MFNSETRPGSHQRSGGSISPSPREVKTEIMGPLEKRGAPRHGEREGTGLKSYFLYSPADTEEVRSSTGLRRNKACSKTPSSRLSNSRASRPSTTAGSSSPPSSPRASPKAFGFASSTTSRRPSASKRGPSRTERLRPVPEDHLVPPVQPPRLLSSQKAADSGARCSHKKPPRRGRHQETHTARRRHEDLGLDVRNSRQKRHDCARHM